jgi:hypothetical protein
VTGSQSTGGLTAKRHVANSAIRNTLSSGQGTSINKLADKNLMLRQFISNYGSHYVLSVQYGARISIRAQLNTLDVSRQQSLSGKIQAAFGALTAGGGLSTQESNSLKSEDIAITAEITAGGVVPNRPVVLTSFDQVAAFLSDFRTGKVTLLSGPISAKLQNYWSTIDSTTLPNISSALAPATGPERSPTPFGVPAGTVIALFPKAGDIVQVGAESRILAPAGWLVCDGTKGTPDLRGKWLTGTVNPSEVRGQVGAAEHSHKVNGTTNVGDGFLPFVPGHQFQTQGSQTASQKYSFTTTSASASNLPPSVRVVYIMKE